MYECDFGEIILQIILEVDENILSLHRKIATGSVGRAVRQRSAKSPSPVRFRMVPPNQLHRIYDGAFSLQFDIHESCGFIANA